MKSIVKYLMILLSVAVATSCLRENFEDDGPCPCDDEKSVMLKLAMPYVAPVTRSIGATQENTIETLDVLAFKVDGGVETFQYWAEAKKAAGNNEGYQTQSFSAKLRVKDYTQRFVLISNARSKIETLMGGQIGHWEGAEKESLLQKLIFELNSGEDRWKAINSANYTAIPMWGETQAKKIEATTTSIGDGNIPMLRMIAKIEVQLDENVAGLTDAFKLKSVHVYNTNTSGRIAPKPGTEYVGADMIAKKASLPAPVTSVVGPLAYNDFSAPGIEDVAMNGAIYLFETAARNTGNFLEETCIVVGGVYGASTNPVTYYRLDFFAQNGATHLDILRNHRYKCNIVAVNGPGFPTVDDAYRAKPYNMEVEIIVWDEGEIRDIYFDGQYMLGVSHDRFELSGEAYDVSSKDNILKIVTDYPSGWNTSVWADIEGTTGSSWLTINPESGSGNMQLTDVRLLAAANTTDADRTAYIHVKAGKITIVVTVVQHPLPGSISISPIEWMLPYTIPVNAEYAITVSCIKSDGVTNDPGAPWTLTSDAPAWCRLSTSRTTAFGAANTSISGTGSQTVYIIAASNPNRDPRTTIVYLGASPSDVKTIVTQWGDPTTITENDGAGNPPINTETYVGAFWKANQTGERIIRINAGVSAANNGSWTASVMWMDDRWGSDDGVLLSTEMVSKTSLASRGVSFTSLMTPSDAENYQLSGYTTTITGDVINGYIIFRIGLRSTYTPTSEYPARYAVVLLSYADNSRHQKLFLRQGEDADYLMHPTDAINSGGMNSATRPAARKFSPYNLTWDVMDARVPLRGALFTDYPTKAGMLFQYASDQTDANERKRYAWNPYNTLISKLWDSRWGGIAFWNTFSIDQEVSPVGYRRPNDGVTNIYETCTTVANSEMRQSLFVIPGASFNYSSETGNSIWGYYADGYFDRRQIVASPTGEANTTVSSGENIAYIGRLFFNYVVGSDRYNASLFFPATGSRYPSTGSLSFAGVDAPYWSASRHISGSLSTGLGLILREGSAGVWKIMESTATPIRSVVE